MSAFVRPKLLHLSARADTPGYHKLKRAAEVEAAGFQLSAEAVDAAAEGRLQAVLEVHRPDVCAVELSVLGALGTERAALLWNIPLICLLETDPSDDELAVLAHFGITQLIPIAEAAPNRIRAAVHLALHARRQPGLPAELSLLKPALDSMQAAVAVLSGEGLVLYANRKWCLEREGAPFVGFTAPVGVNFLTLCRTVDGDFSELGCAAADGVNDVASGKAESFYIEYSINSPERRWYSLRVTRVVGAGSPAEVVVAHLDITRRKANETALAQGEQVFREIGEILAHADKSLGERVGLLLKSVCLRFDYDYGFFCQFVGETVQVKQAAADTGSENIRTSTPLSGDVLELYQDALEPLGIHDLADARREGREFGLAGAARSCHGVSICAGGEVLGCVLFVSSAARALFDDSEKLVLRILAKWIGQNFEHERSESVQQNQRRILERIAAGEKVSETLSILTEWLEEGRDDKFGAILLLSPDGRSLNLAAGSRLPKNLLSSGEKEDIGLGLGSSAAAAFLGELVASQDISTDPLWANLRAAALDFGLKSSLSQPIFSSEGKVLGVCAIYYSSMHRPSEGEIKIMQEAAYLAGIAVERATDENEIRKSEEQLRLITDSLPVLISYVDQHERYQFNNRAYEDWFGVAREKLVGRHIEEIIGARAYKIVEDYVKRALSGQKVLYERNVLRADGDIRLAENQLIPHVGSDGSVQGFFTLVNDVTEKRRQEEALRASEARMHTLVENLPFDLWFCDVEGCLVLQNSLSKQRWGDRPGLKISSIAGDDEILRNWEDCYRRASDGQVVQREITCHSDGEDRTYSTVIAPVIDGDRMLGICGVNLDITERKRAEEALKGSEAQLKLILEQIPALLWTTDRDLRITYSVGSRAGGLSTRDTPVVGQKLSEFLLTDDPKALPLVMHERALEGRAVSFELQRRGRIYEVELEPLVSADGQTLGCIALGLDVTQRRDELKRKRELEAQLQESHKLESLGLLAGGIAHDFNNLLMGVLGNAGLALLDVPGNSTAAARIRDIERTARHAADLTNQLLAYAGRGRFVVQPVDLSQVGREMAALLKTAISKRAELRYDLDTEIPPVDADTTQVRQVIMNLITNASDALEANPGFITIRTGVMELTQPGDLSDIYGDAQLAPGSYVFLEVADSGYGMSAETMRRIFDPFFTTKFQGRGLGLSAVLGIVRSHGGGIRVQSRLGEGTVFQILLPPSKTVAEERRSEPSQLAPVVQPGGTILVVDDEETVREVAASMLVQLGYQVLTAEDGDSAVEILSQHKERIEAIVLDMTMPRLSGEQAFVELRKVKPDIPILLSSGYHAEDTTSLLADRDAVGFLQKPYGPQLLLQGLQKVMGAKGRQPGRVEKLPA